MVLVNVPDRLRRILRLAAVESVVRRPWGGHPSLG
jgi:hypothetical protein